MQWLNEVKLILYAGRTRNAVNISFTSDERDEDKVHTNYGFHSNCAIVSNGIDDLTTKISPIMVFAWISSLNT